MITVFFRYDDLSAISPADLDIGFIEIFRSYGLCCTIAVIPAVSANNYEDASDSDELMLDKKKLELLTQSVKDGAVELALHGWNHRTNITSLPPTPSEFRGLSITEQTSRLRRGCEFLKQGVGVAPKIFVPPWNSYDQTTLLALENTGIEIISANRYSPLVGTSTLRFAPMTIEMRGLRKAIDVARESSDPDQIIGVMLHPYDFCESKDKRCYLTLDGFDQEMRWLIQNPDVAVSSMGVMAGDSQRMSAARFHCNQPSALENIFPPYVKKTYNNPLYLSPVYAQSLRRKGEIYTLVTHLGVVVLAFAGCNAVLVMLPGISDSILKTGQYATALGMILLFARAIHARAIYFRGIALLSALGGAWLALVT